MTCLYKHYIQISKIYLYIIYNIDAAGDIGPFQLAIALTIICLILVLFWPENYGYSENNNNTTTSGGADGVKESSENNKKVEESGMTAMISSIYASSSIIYNSPTILLLGLGQVYI
jgi:hypothetical protein